MDISKIVVDFSYVKKTEVLYDLTLTFDRKELSQEFNACIMQFAHANPIRGFRKGDHLVRHFQRTKGLQILRYIVHTQLERYKILNEYVEAENLFKMYAYAYPEVDMALLKSSKMEIYAVTYGTIDTDIEFPMHYHIEVEASDIDRELHTMRVHHGKNEEVETSSLSDMKEGEFLVFSLEETPTSENGKSAQTNALRYWDVKEGRRKDVFDRQEKGKIISLGVDDLDLDQMEDSGLKQLMDGVEGEKDFSIQKISKQTLAHLNESFFEKALPPKGDVAEGDKSAGLNYTTDLDGVRKYIEETLAKRYGFESDQFFTSRVFEQFLEKNNPQFPEEYLETSYRQYLQNASAGEGKSTKISQDDYDKELTQSYKHESILNALGIHISEEDVRQETLNSIKSFMPETANLTEEQLDQYGQMLQTKSMLTQKRLQESIMSSFKPLATETVTKKAFDQKVSNHSTKK